MFFDRRKRILSLFTLCFYVLSFVPQITSQPQVLGSTGNVPFQTQESSVPVGTGDTVASRLLCQNRDGNESHLMDFTFILL